jgi:hypothetical protein
VKHKINAIYLRLFLCKLYFQLPTGKTVYLTLEEYLDLTDADIQYLVSIDYGEAHLNPFVGSAVESNKKEKVYDFDYLPLEDYDMNNIISDDVPFDDIIDLSDSLDT